MGRAPAVTIFDRLGRWVHRRRWWVIGAWVALLLVALPFAPRAPSALRAGGFTLDTLESARARALLEDELGLPPSALVLVYSSATEPAGSPAFEAAAAAATAAVSSAPHVTGVVSHQLALDQVSTDRTTAYDVLILDLPPDDSPDALPGVRERLAALPAGPVTVALAGGPAFYGDIQTVSESDLRRSEIVSLPLAALTLLLVFGSVVAAGVPLAVGGGAVFVSLAIIWGVAQVTQMSVFVLNLATLLGLGLGVDYSLLMTSRFREELRRRKGPATDGQRSGDFDRADIEAAVRVTVATAGRAVFFSGLTVVLGLTGLILFDFPILRSVGVAGAIVVAMAVLAALTLPAGDPGGARPASRRPAGPEGRRWRRERRSLGPARPAGDAPPGRRLRPDARLPAAPRGALPARPVQRPGRHDPATGGRLPGCLRPLQGKFGEGRFAPLSLAIRTTGPATSAANVSALYDYSRRLAADPRIETVERAGRRGPAAQPRPVPPPLRGARRATRPLRLGPRWRPARRAT